MDKKSLALYGLVLAAVLGNLCTFNVIFGVDFIFGSIFTLIILALFGIRAGVVSALIASCFTVVHWGHFYAIPIFTLEALIVGVIVSRNSKVTIIIADMIFWLTLGLPCVYVFYRYGLKTAPDMLNLIVFKQALNGLFNASVASILIFTVQAYYGGKPVLNLKNPSIRHIIFTGLTFFLLGCSLLVVGIQSHRDESIRTREAAESLTNYSNQIKNYLAVWHTESVEAVNDAAKRITIGIMNEPTKWLDQDGNLQSAYTNPDIQLIVESCRHGRLGFDGVYVGNSEGISVAFYPVVTRQSQTTIGNDYSDRNYFKQVQKNRRPVVSEVFMSRGTVPEPVVAISTPIIYDNKFIGHLSAICKLSTISRQLKVLQIDTNYNLKVFDANSNIILSSSAISDTIDFTKMTGFKAKNVLNGNVQHFVPQNSSSSFSRYKDSLFMLRQPAGFSGWQIITAYPAGIIQQDLVHFVSTGLMIIYFILLMGCPITLLLSNMITRPLVALTQMKDIIKNVKTTGAIDESQWPDSFVSEISELSCGLKEIAYEYLQKSGGEKMDKTSL